VTDPRKPRTAEQHPAGRYARVLGYVSLDPDGGSRRNGEFERQAEMIAFVCERRELLIEGVVREHEPRRGHALERPGLGYALKRIADDEATGLVVSEPFRLAPSLAELGRVLDRLLHEGVRFIAAKPELDTQEEASRLAVQAIIATSRWEHQRLALRTRKGMLAAREKGPRRVADFPDLTQRIGRMRASGLTLQAIADQLNAERVPTMRGGTMWRPSSVQVAAGYHRPPAGEWSSPPPRPPPATEGSEFDGARPRPESEPGGPDDPSSQEAPHHVRS
jgi:DNA invertase Pin-like site-specific DNA recombinase